MEKNEKKMRPGSKTWWKAAVDLALSYAPSIGACKECKQPCLAGYCCTYCGSGSGCTHPESGERVRS